MQAKIQKWGNSLALRIPKAFAEEMKLEQNAVVNINIEDGKLVVNLSRPMFTLEELLAQVTDENLHGEIDWGRPIGKEVW